MGRCSGRRAPGLVTRQQIAIEAHQLGVAPGDTLMLHAAVGSIGWIVGGPDQILLGLLDVLGEGGTLMMYVGWDGSPYDVTCGMPELPPQLAAAWPAYDPKTSRAVRDWGVLAEYIRTLPGAHRSAHPDSSFVAIGRDAEALVADHPLQYGMGAGSPLAKLCEAEGKVLLAGSPLSNVTLLHHAEHLADVPTKEIVTYWQPLLEDGQAKWVQIEEVSTEGCLPWRGGTDLFEAIVSEYIQEGRGSIGRIGAATSYLFAAADLDRFAIDWIEERFADAEPIDLPLDESISVRRAGGEDHRAVASLIVALEEELAGEPFPGSCGSARADELLEADDRRVFLAETAHDVVGMIVASVISPKLGGIDHAYVAPEVRRHGILRELEIEASTYLRDRGCCDVRLHIGAENDVAREAWGSLGYHRTLEFMERPL